MFDLLFDYGASTIQKVSIFLALVIKPEILALKSKLKVTKKKHTRRWPRVFHKLGPFGTVE
jgi:hypothetical protein